MVLNLDTKCMQKSLHSTHHVFTAHCIELIVYIFVSMFSGHYYPARAKILIVSVIDSPFQTFAVGLLIEFIDLLYNCTLQKRFPHCVNQGFSYIRYILLYLN